MALTPVKIFGMNDSILCIFDSKGFEGDLGDISVDTVDGRFMLVVGRSFHIPLEYLDIDSGDARTLYIAGSDAGDIRVELIARVSLGIKAVSKILVYKELKEASMNIKRATTEEEQLSASSSV